MNSTYRSFAFISSLLLLISCKRSITGEGPVISRNFAVSSINGIDLSIAAEVKIVTADSFNCIITAQENIMNAIKVKSDDDVEIKSDYNLNTSEPVSIVLSMPQITRARITGSGKIIFINPCKSEKLKLLINGSGDIFAKSQSSEVRSEINGSGTISIAGSAKELKSEINGSGELHAFNFSADEADVEINGSGNAEVMSETNLKAEIHGSGKIIYKGQPHVVSEVVGSGQIQKAD
jgi:hypothetical protein